MNKLDYKKNGRCPYFFMLFVLVFLFYSQADALEKKKNNSVPVSDRSDKLKRIADFISDGLADKGIKTVAVRPFTDAGGKVTKESAEISDEFTRLLSGMKKGVILKADGPEAIVIGTLARFEGKERRQLRIRAVRAGSNKVITSYTAILQ